MAKMENTENIAFIGCGNMGRSLIGGLLAAGYPAAAIRAVDPAAAARREAAALGVTALGVEALGTEAAAPDAALRDCAVIVLAVKPQQAAATLRSLRALFIPAAPKNHAPDARRESGQTASAPLLISIAAGVTIAALAATLDAGRGVAIVRAMPNTPALIRKGAAAMYANPHVAEPRKRLAERILRAVGIAVWLEREELLDVATAVSGSGPAYFFLFMEMLEKIARELGLDADSARALSAQTAYGAAAMAVAGARSPAELRRQVTSPGGTTEQALQALMDGRLEQALGQAVAAARRRAGELAEEARA